MFDKFQNELCALYGVHSGEPLTNELINDLDGILSFIDKSLNDNHPDVDNMRVILFLLRNSIS